MTETLPDDLKPYPNISPKAYEHPADRAATAALKSVPMLDTVVRKLIEWQYERALRQIYLSNSVRVGERQLPDLWAHHVAVCRILDMPETYDLYVTDTVLANAMAIGSQDPIVVLGSPLLERLGSGEQRAVLAHEVAHILSDHVLYRTALDILLRAGGTFRSRSAIPAARGPGGAAGVVPRRRAQLRPRRGACRPRPADRLPVLMVLAGGMPADHLNLDAFMAQAMEYEDWDDPSDRVRRFFYEIDTTHPVRGPPRLGGDAVGPERRVRPDHSRRVHHAAARSRRSARRPATRWSSTPSASARSSGTSATTSPRSAPGRRRWPSRSPTGSAHGAAGAPATQAARAARQLRRLRQLGGPAAPAVRRPAPERRPAAEPGLGRADAVTARTTPADRAIGGPRGPLLATRRPSTQAHRAGRGPALP